MITFTIPIRLIAAGNAREHWRVVAKRKKEQRELAARWTRNNISPLKLPLCAPIVVTLTRIGKRRMDSDNISCSGKYVRDGIADALGVDDGDEALVSWQYRQELGKDYGCKVQIETKC